MTRSSSLLPALVVGAGPAGATAARTLALAGIPVTLLDRSAFPRNKPCGGGISIRALTRFPHLDAALSRIPSHRVSRLHLEGPDRASTLIDAREPAALLIRRVEFDALLVDLAVEAGATLVTGADIVRAREEPDRVVLNARDGRQFEASLVVAADGVHGGIARRLGIHQGWPAASLALDMMEETGRATLRDVDPSTLWVAYGYDGRTGPRDADGRLLEGYAYIFPKLDHVNVGIGYVLDQYRRDVDASPYSLQRQFVESLRDRGIVEGESNRKNFTPFLIPVGGPLGAPGRGRVLLAGDAGGFVNGVTAEGIFYAMVSGELAGRAVAETTHDTATDARHPLPARRRGRAWRRAARRSQPQALPLREPPPHCGGDRGSGPQSGDDPDGPRLCHRADQLWNTQAPAARPRAAAGGPPDLGPGAREALVPGAGGAGRHALSARGPPDLRVWCNLTQVFDACAGALTRG